MKTIDKVIFVGDRPSRLNTDPNIPFLGTLSHKNLSEWIRFLKITDHGLSNSYTEHQVNRICYAYYWGYIIVALGNEASNRLKARGVPHYKLPHPSPRNRQLNDPKFIEEKLLECKTYIRNYE